MNAYWKLVIIAAVPVLVSGALYLLDRRSCFKKLPFRLRQTLIGLIFGGLAVCGTEFGINIVGATLNVRDAAPICAGLIFGAPAGIIAGFIGGIERWFAASWGAGSYTQIACSVATCFAGLFSAWLRRFMFENRRPAWYYGLATGSITEVLHMLIVLLTHMDDPRTAFGVVVKCAPPMITLTGLSVMCALLLTDLLHILTKGKRVDQTRLSQRFQRGLLICTLVIFSLTGIFTYTLQARLSDTENDELLRLAIQDLRADVENASDDNLLEITHKVARDITARGYVNDRSLVQMAKKYEVTEISIIGRNGIIRTSSDETIVGFDMASGEQSAAFLVLIDKGQEELVQQYQPITMNSDISRKYAGVALDDGTFVQVGYDAELFQKDISHQIELSAANRHVGGTGHLIICDSEMQIVGSSCGLIGKPLTSLGLPEKLPPTQLERFIAQMFGEDCLCMYQLTEGYYIIGVLPLTEAQLSRNLSVVVTLFMEVLIFTALFLLIYSLVKELVVHNLDRITRSLSEISNGNLDIEVNVRSTAEFASLSNDINTTVNTLQRYIDEAAARIDRELEFARSVQVSTLPNTFPAFPDRAEFDIWAGMHPAKEVGGDFYDFYLPDRDHLAFLVADVSGKGIPAAMFMMTAKSTLKSLAESGLPVNEVFTQANRQLCENNESGMFVTAWMGILDLRSGLLKFANAGHNPPLLRHANGCFEYFRSKAGFVLAGIDEFHYRENELQLQPGDVFYLYTDGVTEAHNAFSELYGEDRLRTALGRTGQEDAVEDICAAVRKDMDHYVNDAPQFDDITMLCMRYRGPAGT